MMKKSRQDKILELVVTYCIDTQDELIDRLRESGYDVTQATVSRDIRALNLIKVQTEQGKYRYVQPRREGRSDPETKREGNATALHASAITRVCYALNNVVVKTYPGMAQAVATGIDNIKSDDILGCVAGDDTIFVVATSNEIAQNIGAKIKTMMIEAKSV